MVFVVDVYLYKRKKVGWAVIAFILTEDEGNWSTVCFLNDHFTFSKIHGWVDNFLDEDGCLFKVVAHWHCLGAEALRQHPETQIEMFQGQQEGQIDALDHKLRRVNMTLVTRKMHVLDERQLRAYMEQIWRLKNPARLSL